MRLVHVLCRSHLRARLAILLLGWLCAESVPVLVQLLANGGLLVAAAALLAQVVVLERRCCTCRRAVVVRRAHVLHANAVVLRLHPSAVRWTQVRHRCVRHRRIISRLVRLGPVRRVPHSRLRRAVRMSEQTAHLVRVRVVVLLANSTAIYRVSPTFNSSPVPLRRRGRVGRG